VRSLETSRFHEDFGERGLLKLKPIKYHHNMKIINYKFSLMFFLATFFSCCTTIKPTGNINYVPNEETAIKIAEAILIPIYGNEVLDKKPFTARLINGKIWHVEGTISLDELGGVPIIEIQKSDCKILRITHTK